MKVTDLRARNYNGHLEFGVELNGSYYEFQRMKVGTDAHEFANQLRLLAARIEAIQKLKEGSTK
jgi:hypothetical protein